MSQAAGVAFRLLGAAYKNSGDVAVAVRSFGHSQATKSRRAGMFELGRPVLSHVIDAERGIDARQGITANKDSYGFLRLPSHRRDVSDVLRLRPRRGACYCCFIGVKAFSAVSVAIRPAA